MDSIVAYLASLFGVHAATVPFVLAVIVAVCNLVGKLIPDDATGPLGLLRMVCKVLGLYIANRVVGTLTPSDAVCSVASRIRSPLLVGLAAVGMTLFLMGCTTAQKERVSNGIASVCTSAPLAQALYNTALASHDNQRVNEVLNYLQASCPAILVLVQTVPVKESTPVAPPPAPVITPERG
jgi:hypothetical protein